MRAADDQRFAQIFEQNATVAYFKLQPRDEFCKKSYLENFVNFIGKCLCWSRYLIKLRD